MIDVSDKATTLRIATAKGRLRMSFDSLEIVKTGATPKGDPLPVARVAAVQAVKFTPQLIPFCHPLPIEGVKVEFELGGDADQRLAWVDVVVSVKTIHRTGVEMEALTGASAALLTVYDMLKFIDENMVIESISLEEKKGGKADGIGLRQIPFQAKVIVISDSVSEGRAEDRSGKILVEGLRANGATQVSISVVRDEVAQIQDALQTAINQGAEFVVTTGGTGVGPRDVTPEAVVPLLDRSLPGIEEQFRAYSQRMVPTAMLSRMVAGQMGRSLVLCLPGSPGACKDVFPALFPAVKHFLAVRDGARHGD